ncbi:MAG: AmmeMemoRadiSam system protein A [Candidatus Woesearchaeota archaeon]|jgi:hypothetical protein
MHELIKLAKDSILFFLNNSFNYNDKNLIVLESVKKKYSDNLGVFVTIKIYDELRGCIGYIETDNPLYKSVIECAQLAAFDDPRFEPLTREEFEKITLEISVLTKPQLVSFKTAEELKNKIVVGKHGLIIEKGNKRGLLLPQVATEYNWTSEEFLNHTCSKAGLSQNTWKEKTDFKIFTFEANVIEEND